MALLFLRFWFIVISGKKVKWITDCRYYHYVYPSREERVIYSYGLAYRIVLLMPELAHSRTAGIFIRDTVCFHCDSMNYYSFITVKACRITYENPTVRECASSVAMVTTYHNPFRLKSLYNAQNCHRLDADKDILFQGWQYIQNHWNMDLI